MTHTHMYTHKQIPLLHALDAGDGKIQDAWTSEDKLNLKLLVIQIILWRIPKHGCKVNGTLFQQSNIQLHGVSTSSISSFSVPSWSTQSGCEIAFPLQAERFHGKRELVTS
eukprot:5991983-Amphidinium_carterae.1